MWRDVETLTAGTTESWQGLSIEPYIKQNFLSREECQTIIRSIDEQQVHRARLAGGLEKHAIRSAGACWIDEFELPWLHRKLIRIAADICREHFPFDISGFEEGFQFLRYTAGCKGHFDDFYDWHVDIGKSGKSRFRKLSMIIQLSSPKNYSGGELEINTSGNVRSVPTRQGNLIAFPSFALHRVCSVTSGMRHSLAVWMHGPAFR